MSPLSKLRHARLGAVATAIGALCALPAMAAERYWGYATGCGSADFTSASCWRLGAPGNPGGGTPGTAPAAGDDVFLVRNGADSLTNSFANAASPALPVYRSLTLSGTGGGVVGLNVVRNTLQLSGDANVGDGNGRGRIAQSGGTTRFNTLYIRNGSDYLLSGGSMSLTDLWLTGTGTFNQSGGTATTNPGSLLFMSGSYFLDGGTLDIRNSTFWTNTLGTLELGGGTLLTNAGQTVRASTLNYIGGGGDMLKDARVDANVVNLRNDSGPFRVINLANDVRANTLNVGGSSGLAGNSSAMSFIGGNHVVSGTMTVSAGAGNFSSVNVNGRLANVALTTQQLDVGGVDPAALGSAQIWVQDFGSLVVNGTANVGQANRNGNLLATLGSDVQVNGSLNIFGSATISASSLRAPGQTTVGGRAGASLTITEGGQFIGQAVRTLADGTVTVMNLGEIFGAGTIANTFNNGGVMQFSGSGGSVRGTFINNAGGRVRVDAGATAWFLGDFTGLGGLDIAPGGVARFGDAGLGAVDRRVGFTGGGRSEYEGFVGLAMAASDIVDAGDFVLLDSAYLSVSLGGARLKVGGQLGFAGVLWVQRGSLPLNLSEGSRFDLFDWVTATGSFAGVSFSEVPLASGLRWDISELYTQGVVKVSAVPEPGSLAFLLAGLGAVGLFVARRRRALG